MSTLKERFAALASLKPNISQADLARATGVKPPSVNAWFSGETKTMKAETASKAAQLYGVNPHWLSTGDGQMLLQLVPGSLAHLTREHGPMPDDPNPVGWEDEHQHRPPTLAQALQVLASAFAHTPESTRNTVATLAASAVRDPATLPDCLRAIEALAAYSNATMETAAIHKAEA